MTSNTNCPKCNEPAELGCAILIGAKGGKSIRTFRYHCKNQHCWSEVEEVTCKIDPEYQQQIIDAIRPDLCTFCRKPLNNGMKLWGTIAHSKCRTQKRIEIGIEKPR